MRKVIFKLFYFIYVTLLICSFEVQNFYDRVYKLTILRAEKFRIGSSAARETELSMMNTRMRLVKMWWLMSLWQNTRTLKKNNNKNTADISVIWIATCLCLTNIISAYGFVLLKMKKALPSGIGVIFSFFTRSEMTGRGPDGTSGSSSSAAVSSLSSSSSLNESRKYVMCNTRNFSNCKHVFWLNKIKKRIPCHLYHHLFCPCNEHRYFYKCRLEFDQLSKQIFEVIRCQRETYWTVTLFCLLHLCWEILHLPSCPQR